MGLRTINNAVFCKANPETIERLITIQRYIAYGNPTKKTVETLVRKRGFLRCEDKKTAITNNVLIEKLLGPDVVEGHMGCICVEDVIDTALNCKLEENDVMFQKILENIWPF